MYPDFRADSVSSLEAINSIKTYGCVVLRGLLPVPLIASWRDWIEQAYHYADEQCSAGTLPEHFAKHFLQFGQLPTLMLDWEGAPAYSMIHEIMLATPIRRLMHDVFGPELAILLQFTTPRRQRAADIKRGVPFHQDASFIGNHFFALNCWTPLMPCGVDAANLEVALDGSLEFYKPAGLKNAYAHQSYDELALDENAIKARYGAEKLWHPVMEPGDVLIFSNFTLHRTHHLPEMSKDRISLEMRCTKLTEKLAAHHHVGIVREGTEGMQIFDPLHATAGS